MPKPVQIGAATVFHGDCVELMPTLGQVADAIVCDPPYHLTSGNASFDWSALSPNGAKRPNIGLTNKAGRGHKTGFMNKTWDGGDIAFRPETWRACFDVLKPGGYMLAFGGTRTHHRIWCAIEDAGFVIQDTIMWLYGQGFPKGRTQLKPAFEPICVAYKPGGKRALQIDECRIPTTQPRPARINGNGKSNGIYGDGLNNSRAAGVPDTEIGRWPANCVHDGSDEVMEAFAAFGEKTSGTGIKNPKGSIGYHGRARGEPNNGIGGDTGTAARFFYCAPQDRQCSLCCCTLVEDSNKIRPLTIGSEECVGALFVGKKSRAGAEAELGSIVQRDAPVSGLVETADSEGRLPKRARDAAPNLVTLPATKANTAQLHATQRASAKFARVVKSAGSLCDSCATSIALALVEVRQSGKAASSVGIGSITDARRTILTQSLANYVARRENTDTILTTTSLKEFFGSVFHAIADSTKSENGGSSENTKYEPRRLFYHSKATKADRAGSRHPTVKPVELMRWLVRLVTPPGGTVLDPFAGSGTTGAAALAEGRRAILIEKELEYFNDIKRRLRASPAQLFLPAA